MISLAADFGGTRIKLGVVRDATVMAQSVIAAESGRHLTERLEAVAAGLEKLCEQAGIAPAECDGVGFSYPSIIDRRNARILDHFGKFGDASAIDLRGWAEQRLHLPLAIDNDARMALIGEWRYGAGRGSDNCAIITLGTGIGVSAVIEGQVLRGVHGQAGILGGHTTLRTEGGTCVCGNVGCAELLASTSVIDRLAREHPLFAGSALAKRETIDYAQIFHCASAGDECALSLRNRSLETWAALAVNLIHVFDPELIIFGGGLMGSADEIISFVRDYISRHAHTPWGQVKVAASELGDRAALLACEWLVHEDVEKVN
ncbi:MAG TPA: ROK family protein [Verrucomicrobiae bacterium]|jgi:glucokinase|nr:ROK family protein [Verrucomicrobiae bacterium]